MCSVVDEEIKVRRRELDVKVDQGGKEEYPLSNKCLSWKIS